MFYTVREVTYEVYKDEHPTGIRVGFLYDNPYGENPEENASKGRKYRYLLRMYPETRGYSLVEIKDEEI